MRNSKTTAYQDDNTLDRHAERAECIVDQTHTLNLTDIASPVNRTYARTHQMEHYSDNEGLKDTQETQSTDSETMEREKRKEPTGTTSQAYTQKHTESTTETDTIEENQQQRKQNRTQERREQNETENTPNGCQHEKTPKRKLAEPQLQETPVRNSKQPKIHQTHQLTINADRGTMNRSMTQTNVNTEGAHQAANKRKQRQSENIHENPRKRRK